VDSHQTPWQPVPCSCCSLSSTVSDIIWIRIHRIADKSRRLTSVFQEPLVLLSSEAGMPLRSRAPTWPRCNSEGATTAGGPWWERTSCSRPPIARYAGEIYSPFFMPIYVFLFFKFFYHINRFHLFPLIQAGNLLAVTFCLFTRCTLPVKSFRTPTFFQFLLTF